MADLDSKIPSKRKLTSTCKIRFDGMTYQFVPDSNCSAGFMTGMDVWCYGIPDIGDYFIHRLMCYDAPNNRSGDHYVGYADIILKK